MEYYLQYSLVGSVVDRLMDAGEGEFSLNNV